MKREDLRRAVALAAEQDTDTALLARLSAGEQLRLTIGRDGAESEIVLAAGFARQLRSDLEAAFSARIAERAEAMTQLGLEP
jgi:hypothetical protein